ncbi:MAG TPA: DUF4184 family protein [Haliangium sp.]|nr:DUF4184 family protein [Haliangium sp.]
MPFTPFHLGPAVAIKAAAPRRFSFLVFGFSQVLIDLEPAYYMLQGQAFVHRFFHTYVGATVIGVAALVIGRPVCTWALRLGRALAGRAAAGTRDRSEPRIGLGPAALAAFVGAYSHVLLDSVMHADIRPLAPFSQANPLFRVISLDALHTFCMACAILGLVGLALRARARRT